MIAAILRKTVDEITVRTEVQAVVRSLVDSVETYHKDLNCKELVACAAHLKADIELLMGSLDLAALERKKHESSIEKYRMGAEVVRDKIVSDIGPVLKESKRIYSLYEKIDQLEGIIAGLNEEIESLKAMVPINSGCDSSTDGKAAQPGGASSSNSSSSNTNNDSGGQGFSAEHSGDTSNPLESNASAANGSSHSSSNNMGANNSESSNNSNTISTKATTVGTTIINPPKSLLLDLHDNDLLNIFSFLAPDEILTIGTVCGFLFRRVGGLFGVETDIANPAWETRPATITVVKPSSSSNNNNSNSNSNSNNNSNNNIKSSSNGGNNNNSSSHNSNSTSPTATNISNNNNININGNNNNSNNTTTATGNINNSTGLTREIADSLTKKLSPQEVKVIANMTDRLKKQTQTIEVLTSEKEDIGARLQNAESVRDLLIDKLRSAEIAIKTELKKNNIFNMQALADQEVISYLDIRSQECEGLLADLKQDYSQMKVTLEMRAKALYVENSQLNTENQELKSRLEAIESKFKGEKKVLVKEVKSLRVQLDAVTTERNRFAGQIRAFKDVLGAGGSAT